ncbi:hypothetical protein TIFTF001_024823 [Ficus carica]|uniref:Uncharacterized protein n=1 Tax=Ficus carica TaxID=3494 RepID=A0AA88AHK5_FICCA|nr:hypothetical protein TIFTF001_024823 [Ficus carica]
MKVSVQPLGLNADDLNTTDKPPFSGNAGTRPNLTVSPGRPRVLGPDYAPSTLFQGMNSQIQICLACSRRLFRRADLEAFPVEAEYSEDRVPDRPCATSIPGPYSANNPGLGIGHVDDPPAADATHLLLSPVKSPLAANHSDGHCCPFTGNAHGTLPLTVQGLGPRGVHLLGQ